MLIIHASNRLEILADHLAELVRHPCGAPWLLEVIIVQSTGMARRLSSHLAQRLEICAQIRFPFPAAFVWNLFRQLLPSVPDRSPVDPDVLAWRIMALLEELEDVPRFAPLHAYCADGDDDKRFALASCIADVFDQYLVYRPDWIRQWERGEDEHWQATLWRRLVMSSTVHRVRLHEQLLTALQAEGVAHKGLPARVSLIGIPTMPPLYLDMFAHLATCIDVHCFVLTPCQEAWGALLAERDRAQYVSMGDPDTRPHAKGHRLPAKGGSHVTRDI